MGQQSLIYSFVARGTVILAEYTEFTGNFTGIASQCLQKLPASNNKFTYNCDGHTFNYLVEDGFSMSHIYVFDLLCYAFSSTLSSAPNSDIDLGFFDFVDFFSLRICVFDHSTVLYIYIYSGICLSTYMYTCVSLCVLNHEGVDYVELFLDL